MPVKKHFVNRGLQHILIEEFLASELDNSGYAGCSLQKTPMGTRITIRTSRPGIVIGRRGSKVKELTESVKEKFNINVPTIDVETVENPELNATIQAERIAYSIQKGQNYRRATYGIVRRIIRAGARGVEVHITGKVTSQRARHQVFRAGIISKCGTPADEGVDKGVCHLTLKSGVLGIRVKIMPESYQLPDEVKILEGIFDRTVEEKKAGEGVDEFYDELPAEVVEEEIFDDVSDAGEVSISTDSEDKLEEIKEADEDILEDLEEKEDTELKEE